MRHEEFLEKFKAQCAFFPREKQHALAIEICKRLFPAYKKFSKNHNWGNPDLMFDAIDTAGRSDLKNTDVKFISALLPKIMSITPDTEDFGDASCALNSSASVYETLQFIIDNDSKHIFNVVNYLTDSVDSKIREEADWTDEQIDRHPLMLEVREFLMDATR